MTAFIIASSSACGGELGTDADARVDADVDLGDGDIDHDADELADADDPADADELADADDPIDADEPVDADDPADADDSIDADEPVDADIAPTGPLRLYLTVDGDDDNDGMSEVSAVATLARVHERLVELAPDRDVEVRIGPGRYQGQTVVWTYTMPSHVIRLMTLNDDHDRPIFDGCLVAEPTDPESQCPGGTWFRLRHAAGEETNLHFDYIRVERYGTAISFNGGRNAEADSNGSNRIYGCYFFQIGNVFNSALDPATAAVRLVNSDDNEIANNHFVEVVNTRSGGLIHCLYVAHMSDRNTIARNRFQRSSGDPVRLRDFSNDNTIEDNRFIQVGVNAGYTDWYCDHEVRDDCTKPEAECPSWGNWFRDNTLDGTWACTPLSTWHLFQDDETAGCAPPSAEARRVRTVGNSRTTTPCSS